MTKQRVDQILISIGYYDSFKTLMNEKYPEINYGKRIGTISFKSIFDADERYAYNGSVEEDQVNDWHKTLISKESSEEQLLVVCLKIFNWGKVLNGNVKSVVELYESGNLKQYIRFITGLLTSESTIVSNDEPEFEIIWSSGWTKVYSFINNDILIYDSRVSAFLNFTLVYSYGALSKEAKDDFCELSSCLYNFGGAPTRKRKIANAFGFINQHPKGKRGFNANLISSWITQLTNEKLILNKDMRSFERAFFMLGFDLNQIGLFTRMED